MSYIKNKLKFKVLAFAVITALLFWSVPSSLVFGEGESTDIEVLQQAVTDAQVALDAAQDAASVASDALVAAKTASDEANAALDAAQKAADEAAAKLADAKIAADAANAAVADAEKTLADAQADLDAAGEGEDKTELQQAVTVAQVALDAAQDTARAANDALVAAKTASDEANASLEAAQKAADEAAAKLADAKIAADAANAAVADAEKTLADAQADLDAALAALGEKEDGDGDNPIGGFGGMTMMTMGGGYGGTLTVHKFGDTNGNGSQNGSEPDLSGVDFKLSIGTWSGGWNGHWNWSIVSTKTTDGSGDVSWDNLWGHYKVEEINTPAGYQTDTGKKWEGDIYNGSTTVNVSNVPVVVCEDVQVFLAPSWVGASCDDNETQENSDNGGITTPGVVWHFILNGLAKDTPKATLYGEFESKGSFEEEARDGGQTQHFYVWTPTCDSLVDDSSAVYALVDSCGYNNLVLSHVCHNDPVTADIYFNKDFKDTGGSNLSSPGVFNIYDASDTGFSNPLKPSVSLYEDGEVRFEDLEPGNYVIVEDPAGVHSDGTPYAPMPDIKVTVNDDGSVTFTAPSGFRNGKTVYNYKVPTGEIKVKKDVQGTSYDSQQFEVELYVNDSYATFDPDNPTSNGWSLIAGGTKFISETTGGSATWDKLLKEKYYEVREINIPSGYSFVSTNGPKELACEVEIKVTNEKIQTYKISGWKFNSKGTAYSWDDTGLNGWTINLKDSQGNIIDTTTTANWMGYSSFPGYYEFTGLQAGDYTVEEVMQSGWTNDTPVSISVTLPVVYHGDSINNNFKNHEALTGKITVTKTGLEGSDQAKLYLYDSDDNLINTATAPSPQTVSNNGTAKWLDLPYGDYYIEEDFAGITNIYSYTVSNPVAEITVDGDETDTITNELKRYDISFSKVFEGMEEGTSISAAFTLFYDPDGTVAVSGVDITGSNPVSITQAGDTVTFSGVVPGDYVIKETTTPAGYETIDPIYVTLDEDGEVSGLDEVVKNERIPGKIILTKDYEGDVVDSFFYLTDGTNYYLTDGTATSVKTTYKIDVNGGTITWENLPWGIDLTIGEEPINGYTSNFDTTMPIEIDENTPDQTVNVLATNRELGSIEIYKTDQFDGSPLEGSTFQLIKYSSPGVVIDTIVLGPGSGGYHKWSNLAWGTYGVKEIIAPMGYEVRDEVMVTIEEGNLHVTLKEEIADPRKPGTIGILKLDEDGDPMTGAGFTLYNSSGTVVVRAEKFTDAAGKVAFSGLDWGTYLIVETTVPDDYEKADDVTVIINAANAGKTVNITITNDPEETTTVTVAGMTEGTIQVLGITELPFTGMHPAIPISGISSLVAGGLMVILSRIRRKNR